MHSFSEVYSMRFRSAVVVAALCAILCACVPAGARAAQGAQNGATPYQRLEVVRQRLESQRRALASAVANLGGEEQKKNDKKNAQTAAGAQSDAAARLTGLEKESASLLSEVSDIRAHMEHS